MVKWLTQNKWLILVILIATFLRVYRLDYLELFGDEIDAGYQSYSLLMTGRDYKGHLIPAYAQSFSEWRAPGLMYAMVPFIKIFGLNEWGVRLCSAFFGITLILAWNWLLKTLLVDKKLRLLSCLLLAIVPWQVQYSRSGFELTMMSNFLILGTVFWIKSLKLDQKRLTVYAALCYVIALYTYNTANLYVPLLVFVSGMVFGWQPRKMIRLFCLGFILSLPLIINIIWGSAASRFKLFSVWNNKEVAAEVNTLRNEAGNSFSSKIVYNKYVISAKKIAFNYSNALGSNFLFNEGDVTFRQSLHKVGNLFWIMLPLIIFGLYKSFGGKKLEVSDKYMLWFTLISPIPASLTIDGYNHASRLFLLSLPLAYWAAKGWVSLKKKLLLLVVLILIFEFSNYQLFYWKNYRQESWKWWHTGYKELMTDIKLEKSNYGKVIIDNVYEPSLIRYLFWNKIEPKEVQNIVDKMEQKVDDSFNAFKMPNENIYFADFNGPIKTSLLRKGTLYAFSQDINVVGDRDLNIEPPEGIEILKTIRNYNGIPLFYLVSKK